MIQNPGVQLAIVGPDGKPLRRPADDKCPKCGADPETRVASGGFGTPHPVCPCGFEFFDEVWGG